MIIRSTVSPLILLKSVYFPARPRQEWISITIYIPVRMRPACLGAHYLWTSPLILSQALSLIPMLMKNLATTLTQSYVGIV